MNVHDEWQGAAAAARSMEHQAAPWIEKLARFGYAAKGVVYIIVGVIAARAAFGSGDAEGSSGALGSLRDEPFGQVLLWLIAIGLFGYVVWQAVLAVRNPEGDETGKRIFHGVSAVIHGGLALTALRLAQGGSEGGGSDVTATLMAAPFGRILVGLAGLLVAGYGIHQMWNAWTVDLDDHLDLSRLSATARTWAVRTGRAGLAARGIVMAILGYMFITAALRANPSSSDDVEGVLDSMRDHPWLLAIVALGLVAYGIYSLVRARYRRIRAGRSY